MSVSLREVNVKITWDLCGEITPEAIENALTNEFHGRFEVSLIGKCGSKRSENGL